MAKAARDKHDRHIEVIGLAGTNGRFGGGPVISIPLPARTRFTTQQFVTKGAGDVALNFFPRGVWAYAGFYQLEWDAREGFEIYALGGLVYGGRSHGNRRLWEDTLGFSKRLFKNRFTSPKLDGQYSFVNRATWNAGTGTLNYGMLGVTYNFSQ